MLIYTFCILHFCSGSPLLRLTRMICLHSQPFIQLRSPAVFVYRAMSRILRARLAGAQAVLEKDMCQEARETVSKLQARAISDQLKREGDTMSTDDAVNITETLVKIRFPDNIRDSLLSSIVCSDAKRRKQQDFTISIVFLAASMWTTLLSTSAADTAKMEALALHLILMGCVNPTEPTTKLASSLFMIATMGYRKASELSAFHKGQFKAMHAAMENMVRSGATSCGAYISKLPKCPADCPLCFLMCSDASSRQIRQSSHALMCPRSCASMHRAIVGAAVRRDRWSHRSSRPLARRSRPKSCKRLW